MSANLILIVDDNEDDFFAASRMLVRAGITNPIKHVQSGEDALDYLSGEGQYAGQEIQKPGLILLDINMPGMKGTEVLTKIRSDLSLTTSPVVMLTSSNADRDVLASFQGGANAFVGKPLTLTSLLEAISRVKTHKLELRLVPVR